MKFPPAASTPGVLHFIPPNLSAFEPSKPLARSMNINTLIWIGGMFDTLGSVAYPYNLAQALGPMWSLVACSLGSAGMSWGVTSIKSDAEDMAKIVSYIKEKRPGGRILIMGHSTGCQDCMEYLVGKGSEQRPCVDGVILQAPVSDREALDLDLPQAHKHEADQTALKMCREGHADDALPSRLSKPIFGSLAITARRWCDVSCPDGADDYFSSDLPVERLKSTFGRLSSTTPLLVLYSGSDEAVATKIDKNKLVQTWSAVVKEHDGIVDEINGGVVPDASHNYNGDAVEVVQDLVTRVLGFVARIDNCEFDGKSSSMA